MKPLFKTDYVLYDKANDHVIQFSNGSIVIFGNKEEADDFCRDNEIVTPCTELPQHWQEQLIKQINAEDTL
jgi:hypothetical protein